MGVSLVGKAATRAFMFWVILYIIAIHVGMLFTGPKQPSVPSSSDQIALNESVLNEALPSTEEAIEEEEEEEEIVEEIVEEIKEVLVYRDKIIEEEEIIYEDEEEEEEPPQEEVEEEEGEVEIEEVIVVKKKNFPSAHTVEKLRKQWDTIRKEEKKLANANKKKLSLLTTSMNVLTQRDNVKRPGSDENNSKHKMREMDTLLWYESLSQLEEYELERSFQSLIKEIEEGLSDPQNIRWDTLDRLWFEKSFPRLESDATEVQYQKCPKIPGNSVDDTIPIEDMARESDLKAKIDEIDASLSERLERARSTTASSLPPLWNKDVIDRLKESMVSNAKEGVRRQEELIDAAIEDAEEKLEQAIAEREKHATEHSDDNCIEPSDVEWLVDEGLSALERKQDLRSALVKALRSLDAEAADKVILDAMLPFKPPQRPPQKNKVNLRQVLDTPLLSQQLPRWIDFVVDKVSGYSDFLDEAIDGILQNQVNKDEDSVGKVLVAYILKLAGKVEVPNLLKDVPDPGALRP